MKFKGLKADFKTVRVEVWRHQAASCSTFEKLQPERIDRQRYGCKSEEPPVPLFMLTEDGCGQVRPPHTTQVRLDALLLEV